MDQDKANLNNTAGKKPQTKDPKANQGKGSEVTDMEEKGAQVKEDVDMNEMNLLDDFISNMKELGYGK